jgi:peptidoglycan/LPS O-acetylase OafA/YrhL
VVQPWYVVWPLALAAVVRLPHRVWLFAVGASVWLAMMITPQGENLFLEIGPTFATGLAGAVAAYAVLSHERGRLPLVEPTISDGSALDRIGTAVHDTAVVLDTAIAQAVSTTVPASPGAVPAAGSGG